MRPYSQSLLSFDMIWMEGWLGGKGAYDDEVI
jgi:hypothetical protein